MANSIVQSEAYVPVLDEVYKLASLTAVLDSNQELVSFSAGSRTFKVPTISMQGLAGGNRANPSVTNGTYVEGDVTLTWATVTPDYDRNRMFIVDAMDQEESQGLAFGQLAGEFIRTKVVPEVDAARFARLFQRGSKVASGANLTTGAGVITAISVGSQAMDDAEVPYEGRWLFITPALHNLIINLNTDESREILAQFGGRIVKVPQSRFKTNIKLLTSGAGGYADAVLDDPLNFAGTAAAKNLNFMIVHPSAVIQSVKHVAPKIISPEANQTGDAFKFGYRIYGIVDVLGNKTAGIYSHLAA